MTGRRRLGLVAAGATLLAAAPISSIFDSWTWLLECILAVGFIAGAAVLARTLRFPVWAQALSMVAMLLLALAWMFPSGDELVALLPTPATFSHFGQLMAQAGSDTRNYGVPVPDREGLLFITVLGIGGVAILVDLLTVVIRRPALAGLPMLAIYSVPVAVYIDDVPVVPFIVGAAGFLWLLVADNVDRVRRFGRRFTGDGRDVDVWEPSPLAAAGRRLALIGVAAAVLLPLAIPGITTGLLSQLTQTGGGVGGGGGGGGGGGRINLFASLSGQLSQPDTKELVRVTTNEQDPFYLRIGVADTVTEQGFTSRSSTGRSLRNNPFQDPRTDSDTDKASYQEYRATIENTGLDQSQLAPIYAIPMSVKDLNGSWFYDTNAQALYSPRTTTKGKKYTIDYLRAGFSPLQLRTAQPLASDNPLKVYLTNVPKDDTVVKLVNGLIQGKRTDYDRVLAIYQYFSRDNGFTYSLQAPTTGTSGTDIEAFLNKKAGFCQQYAAAMAWMVRAAGIPARVAFGFTRGGTKDGDTFIITNRNAHAWTEVYFNGFGWVPFDATPSASIVGSSRSAWAPDTDRTAATPSASASGGVTSPNTDPSAAAPNNERPDNDKGLAASGSTASVSGSRTALLVVGIAAVIIALLLVPAVRRALLRRHRRHATVPRSEVVVAGPAQPGSREVVVTMEAVRARHDAHAAWDELIDTMVDFRVPVDPTETPRHTARRLVREADLVKAPARSVTLLGSAEERARYAREPLQGGELTSAVAEVRKGLARTATLRTRLAAVLMPPSVVLRWRLSLADASARWVGRLGRIRDVLAQWSPRRLLTSRSRG
jgi:transglutaminase-like putative cysteine protease